MRFITEFELKKEELGDAWVSSLLSSEKNLKLGSDISERFGWQSLDGTNRICYKLEIEAFPMGKWVEFKNALFSYISKTGEMISGTQILQMIKDLESFGKPAEAKEQNHG